MSRGYLYAFPRWMANAFVNLWRFALYALHYHHAYYAYLAYEKTGLPESYAAITMMFDEQEKEKLEREYKIYRDAKFEILIAREFYYGLLLILGTGAFLTLFFAMDERKSYFKRDALPAPQSDENTERGFSSPVRGARPEEKTGADVNRERSQF